MGGQNLLYQLWLFAELNLIRYSKMEHFLYWAFAKNKKKIFPKYRISLNVGTLHCNCLTVIFTLALVWAHNIKLQHPVALHRSDFALHFLPSMCSVC
jgi:hypothetical protein